MRVSRSLFYSNSEVTRLAKVQKKRRVGGKTQSDRRTLVSPRICAPVEVVVLVCFCYYFYRCWCDGGRVSFRELLLRQ